MFKNMSRKPVVDNHIEQHYNQDQLLAMVHRLMNERDVLWRENEYLKAKLNESMLMETINEMKRERDLLLKLLINLTATNKSNHNSHQHHPDEQNLYQNYYPTEISNGYSLDLLPPAPYQTYSNVTNGHNLQNINSPSSKKTPRNVREQNVQNFEVKTPRRSHRAKPQVEQQATQPAAVYRVEGTKECLMNPDELSNVFAHVKHSHPNKKIVVYKTSTTPQTPEFHQLVDEMCIKHGVELKHSQNSPFQQYRSQSLQDLTSNSINNFAGQQRDFDFQFQPIEKQETIRTNHSKKSS